MGNREQSVSLGCGTLILIAIIVMIFSSSNDQDIERELKQLKSEVQLLKSAVEAQTTELQKLQRESQTPEP
jgi:type II secretory pathway component PulM